MGREAIYAFQAYVVQVSWVSLVSGLKGLTFSTRDERNLSLELSGRFLVNHLSLKVSNET